MVIGCETQHRPPKPRNGSRVVSGTPQNVAAVLKGELRTACVLKLIERMIISSASFQTQTWTLQITFCLIRVEIRETSERPPQCRAVPASKTCCKVGVVCNKAFATFGSGAQITQIGVRNASKNHKKGKFHPDRTHLAHRERLADGNPSTPPQLLGCRKQQKYRKSRQEL